MLHCTGWRRPRASVTSRPAAKPGMPDAGARLSQGMPMTWSRAASARSRRSGSRRSWLWLAARGLAFNEARTRIIEVREGFGFLGFSIRRYRNGKLLIKPGDAAFQEDQAAAEGGVPAAPRVERRGR